MYCFVFFTYLINNGYYIKELENRKDILNTLETHPFCKVYKIPVKLFYDTHELSNKKQ